MAFDPYVSRLLELYRGEPLPVRLHNRVRAGSCPLAAIHEHVPVVGRLVDVGAGRGLVANYLALRAVDRMVVGIEPDAAKVATASRCAVAGQARFEVGAADGPLPEAVDAVTIVDVLYLLPPAAQDTLVRRAAAALRPGGRLVIKEMATDVAWKMRWNRVQETLAVRVLGWTVSSGTFCYRPPEELVAVMEAAGLRAFSRRVDFLSVHPHALVIGTRR